MGAPVLVLIGKSRTADLAIDGLRSIAGQSGPALSLRPVVADDDSRVDWFDRPAAAVAVPSAKKVGQGPGEGR